MPTLRIHFSKEFEVDRILYTTSKLPWYREHQYFPRLPEQCENSKSALKKEDIAAIVEAEFDEPFFQTQRRYILEHWKTGFESNAELLPKILPHLEKEYDVYLTAYGTGGSYDYPREIIANVKFWYDKGLVSDVLHEMVHLGIHPLIEKHNIPHWAKERIVDILTRKISPTFGNLQKERIDVTPIDSALEEFFPDIPTAIASLEGYSFKHLSQ